MKKFSGNYKRNSKEGNSSLDNRNGKRENSFKSGKSSNRQKSFNSDKFGKRDKSFKSDKSYNNKNVNHSFNSKSKKPYNSNKSNSNNDNQHKSKKEILLDFDGTNLKTLKTKSSPYVLDQGDNLLINEERKKLGWNDFDLNEKILSNLKKLKFEKPTEIQSKVLGYCQSKTDLVVQARTGEGKTLCFGIPIANDILNTYEKNHEIKKKVSPIALILVPTRELGIQIKNHIENILIDHQRMYEEKKELEKSLKEEESKIKNGKLTKKTKEKKLPNRLYHNIKVANIMGGFTKVKQIKIMSRHKPEIIVATPGRLWELIEAEEISIDFRYLKYLVIDEADRMMQKHHFAELKKIVKKVYNEKEKNYTNSEELGQKLKEKIASIGKVTDASTLAINNNLSLKEGKEDSDENESYKNELSEDEDIEEYDEENISQEDKDEIEHEMSQDEKYQDEFNEDLFIEKLLKEKGIENAKIENVDMTDLLNTMKSDLVDETGFVVSKKEKKEINKNHL